MKISHKKYTFFLFIILFLPASLAPAKTKNLEVKTLYNKKYISLYDFIKTFGINNSFDIISERGKLYHKGSFAVYQVGFSIILIDGVLGKSKYPVIRHKGEIFFPVDIIDNIVNHFYPYITTRLKGNLYCFYHTPKTSTKKTTVISGANKIPIETSRDRISFIIIDPGHGGKDPGAIGKGGLKEKWINLKVSKLLETYLKKKLKGIKIKLTRRTDIFLELERRTKIANNMMKYNQNGLFISIHVNASISQKISGFETYFLSPNPTNEEARTTAALENNVVILENKSSRKSYDDVEYIEAIMLTTQIHKESSMLAKCIQKKLDEKIWKFKSKGVKKADFFVLRGTLMPAVLVEIGFITNKKEARHLKKSNYQKKIARGIGDGIILMIKRYNKQIKNK